MKITIRKMTIGDYAEVFALWSVCDGVGLAEGDSRDDIRRFLRRNPGLSFVAVSANHIVGAVLGSHDGRRGFLYHLAVIPEHRRAGIGRLLVQRALLALGSLGIPKCHVVVFRRNRAGRAFWRSIGWEARTRLCLMSIYTARRKSKRREAK